MTRTLTRRTATIATRSVGSASSSERIGEGIGE